MKKKYIKVNLDYLQRLLCSFDYFICEQIENVLADSENDPHFSAVFTCNYIIWSISLRKDMGEKLPYHDVRGYFQANGYEEEYEEFEKKRRKEAEIFEGEQL